ncbi:type II toxin-antitoxin system death-on-curing family toxin [Chryseobacterium sp. T9W2-O]|uniref:Type II toxin-antitoxin system death-on-curing family toxin n=2 Tax=Chryseobacterium salviniae TaxID=3101750 RepID=A0ABU6HMS3_9FLAO|nr:type II toxin-antitoxin system death-on-curing family toxin [Chryseobacterium sp. T9W2-O]MEC3874273.1 type II toxin-antitoxin system death-on-curing family toxin [Chryseobacterium sp. T9W2-O]
MQVSENPLVQGAVLDVVTGGIGGKLLGRLFSSSKKVFNAEAFADEIVALNKATDGGGVLLNGSPSSAINSAMYYETAAEQGASIFKSISNGHMFMNGNKRTAVAAFESFAKQHGIKTVSKQQMMNASTQVATGKVTDVSQIAKMLTK